MITNLDKILKKDNDKKAQYKLYGRIETGKAIIFGLQHVFSMFIGNLTPILIIGGLCGLSNDAILANIIQNAMLIAGIITLVQAITIGPIGAGLPCVMGTSASFIAVMSTIIKSMGGGIVAYGTILGASLIGGFFATTLGIFIKPLRKFLPPLVTGIVVLVIGFKLISVGAQSFCGGSGSEDFGSLVNIIVGCSVLTIILIFKHTSKGLLSNASILLGIICGYIICSILPMFIDATFINETGNEQLHSWVIQWDKLNDVPWFSLPQLLPVDLVFDINAIIPISFMFIVTTVETVGNLSGITEIGLGREAKSSELSGGVICEGLGTSLAAIFGVLPSNSFGQNVGIISMTKIVNIFSICTGCLFLILCGFMPKIATIILIMPQPVLGGAAVLMFCSILVIGIKMITKKKIDERAVTIISTSIGLSFTLNYIPNAITEMPLLLNIFLSSPILMSAIIAILLNILIPENKKDKQILEQ